MFRLVISQLLPVALFSISVMAQPPIGSVGVQDATVSGALEVTGGRAVLVGSSAITAKDHSAEVALTRGGTVRVCSTSALHVTAGKATADVQPLMLALDRGAIELQMAATADDVVLTPDLRFAIGGSGPLDLRLRVGRNGDTCVENRGAAAPMLHIADQFGEASYDLHAGQHVLFEHGSLKEVVDNESSPCGCPPEPVMSIADAVISSPASGVPETTTTPKQAEEQHPFPAAVSQGLAPATPTPPTQSGTVHTQVAATLSYGANASPDSTASAPTSNTKTTSSTNNTGSTSVAASSGAAVGHASGGGEATTTTAQVQPPSTPSNSNDLAHRIGRFFRRLFSKG
jgi:hypothetical protein